MVNLVLLRQSDAAGKCSCPEILLAGRSPIGLGIRLMGLYGKGVNPSNWPRQGVEAQRRKASPSRRHDTWCIGGISYHEYT